AALRLLDAVRPRLVPRRERFGRHRQVDRARVLRRRLLDGRDDTPSAVAQALRDDGDLAPFPRCRDLRAVDHGHTSLAVGVCNAPASDSRSACGPLLAMTYATMYRSVNESPRRPRPRASSHPSDEVRTMRLKTAIAMTGMAVGLLTGPGLAPDGRSADIKQDRRDIRQDRRDLGNDRRDVRQDRRDIRQDKRDITSDTRDIRADRRDLSADRRELGADRKAGDKDAVKNDLKDIRSD